MADLLTRIFRAVLDYLFSRRARAKKRDERSWEKQSQKTKDVAKRWREK